MEAVGSKSNKEGLLFTNDCLRVLLKFSRELDSGEMRLK